jgi:hypothetical protein
LHFPISRFDHKLESFGVDLNTLKAKVPERIFRAWLEDWEKEAIKHNDVVSERKLLEKYKGLMFWDDQEKCYQTIVEDNLEWRTRTRDKTSYTGWYCIAEDEKGDCSPWEICDSLGTFISMCDQPEGVKVIEKDTGTGGDDSKDEE